MQKKQYDVVVIGGGPAGMMEAINAARYKRKVTILEKNKSMGEKLTEYRYFPKIC